MSIRSLKIRELGLIAGACMLFMANVSAQYKEFKLSPTGDTLNAIDQKGLKQGKWVISVPELRGEPGYDEEGIFKDGKKFGTWRRYNTTGDILAIENYKYGGKDGTQEYFSFLGDLQRQEQWRAYNPDAPYDTIPVYGTGSNEILSYKVVRAEQYSVPHGEWKYYDGTGRITKFEKYDRGHLDKREAEQPATAVAKTEEPESKEKVKTKEILEYEKKYSKKKRKQLERVGKTGL